MKRFFTMLALVGMSVVAGTKTPVNVYIDHRASMAPGTLSLAEALAEQMFKTADIDLKWRTGRPQSDAIVVELTSRTPPDLHPGALAYAEPFDGVHIRVFYDRLEKMAGYDRAPRLLAHVLVHEITHILEGLEHHSKTGVMKAHWSEEDIFAMARQPLPFDPADVSLIQLGLTHRNTLVLANAGRH